MKTQSNTPAEREFFQSLHAGDAHTIRVLVQDNPQLLHAYDYSCFGATPITSLAFHDRREFIELLLDLGADVNRCSNWEMGPWSPLHCAVYSRNHALARFLIDRGGIIDAVTAAGLGDVACLRNILDETPEAVQARGGDGCQPLHFADTIETAELLLDRGADINGRCIDHYSTPVQYLAIPRPDVARYLFSRGAEPDIFSAVLAGDESVVQHLIAQDPQVVNERINPRRFPPGPERNAHNVLSFTIGTECGPLHAAARGNQPRLVEILVAAGSSTDQRGGYDDQTPLHSAAWHDLADVAQALIDQGANIDALSGKIHNNSPAGWAIVAGSADTFDLLMDHGASQLDWFLDDARDALAGRFRLFKSVPLENHQRILQRLQS